MPGPLLNSYRQYRVGEENTDFAPTHIRNGMLLNKSFMHKTINQCSFMEYSTASTQGEGK